MIRLILVFVIVLFNFFPSICQSTFNQKVELFFETNGAMISADKQAELSSVVQHLDQLGDYSLTIDAFTDSRGTDDFNYALAQRRANSVIDFFENKGLVTDDVVVKSFGESRAGNDLYSDQKLQQNRRVDVYIKGWNWESISDLENELKKDMNQSYTINVDKDQIIEGKEGGKYHIPQNAFVNDKGEKVTGEIDVKLIECFELDDMIKYGLVTTSKDKILSSGGMFMIEGYQDGHKLALDKKSKILTTVPTNDLQGGMTLFEGTHDNVDAEGLDWQDTEQAVSSKFPRLKFIPRPPRPQKLADSMLIKKLVDPRDIDELQDLVKPKKPRIGKPVKPTLHDYNKLVYINRSFKDRFLSKSKREALNQEKRTKAKEKYNERLERYITMKPKYDSVMSVYNAEMQLYKDKRASIIDENGHLVVNCQTYKSLAELINKNYDTALLKYKSDSTLYSKYFALQKQKMEDKIENLKELNVNHLNFYVASVSNLGWLNIDRFKKEELLASLEVKETNRTDPKALVHFIIPKEKIVLKLHFDKTTQQYVLPKIPLGCEAKIVAIKVVGNKSYMSTQNLVTERNQNITLDYKAVRLKEISAAMASL